MEGKCAPGCSLVNLINYKYLYAFKPPVTYLQIRLLAVTYFGFFQKVLYCFKDVIICL